METVVSHTARTWLCVWDLYVFLSGNDKISYFCVILTTKYFKISVYYTNERVEFKV